MYSYLTRLKTSLFTIKIFTHYDEGTPTTLFASGPPPSKIHPCLFDNFNYMLMLIFSLFLYIFIPGNAFEDDLGLTELNLGIDIMPHDSNNDDNNSVCSSLGSGFHQPSSSK